MKYLKVRRKGYRYYSNRWKKWVRVRPTTYYRKDVGTPGRGRAVLPPIRKVGAMTKIARLMGYDRPTDIPNRLIPEYSDRLVEAYGVKSALGMIRRQLVYRKRMDDGAKSKFELMDIYIRENYTAKYA